MSAVTIRPASPADAAEMAELIDYAGEGLPVHLWSSMAEAGESPMDVGRRRAARDVGSFSWRNALMAERNGRVAGMLTGYPITAEEDIPDDLPSLFRALTELENLAIGSWYVNVLACHPDQRNAGVGTALMAEAERQATAAGLGSLSVIVFDTNTGARRLYERHGYAERATRPFDPAGWSTDNRAAVLLVKEGAGV